MLEEGRVALSGQQERNWGVGGPGEGHPPHWRAILSLQLPSLSTGWDGCRVVTGRPPALCTCKGTLFQVLTARLPPWPEGALPAWLSGPRPSPA